MEEVKKLEPLIYAANNGVPRAHFEALLNSDFWEIGASGNIYDREFVLNTLDERRKNPRKETWRTFDFNLRRIEENHFLLTYSLQQPTRLSRRMTLWQKTPEGWKMIYHQGTPVI
ncbi:DUF4440 domain-containing protein [Azotobacter beijerinckii]|uniref:DUF4440 domain-containing protein n=1 Tax=Azotobacter beijerinckii TaxID=170623 RepID=A0A1I4A1Z9_9GAMM|nr:DUF4440 domain-containing protein [Azotobacter beijerinckii]SFA86511.1 hypothetical protein SAMN04244571_00600 [Azotobacter beijerinckii]SFK49971.1 hypothetical protein SAMN04244574_00827 [Azotobacter beijerinckii]